MSDEKKRLDPEEVAACRRVLEAIVADRTILAGVPAEERKALLIAAGRASRPERTELVQLAKARRRMDRREERAEDRALVATSGLRTLRRAPALYPGPAPRDEAPQLPRADEEPPAGSDARAPSLSGSEAGRAAAPAGPELNRERICYVCKARFTRVHSFYDSMCEPCGAFNFAKRSQTADLRGTVALVTGARVKIGFQSSLLLLRAGAGVVATTRFPVDAAARYAREPDFEEWKGRLRIHGLDLRHFPSVETFAEHLLATSDRLDFVINNACQTVRRPPGWYEHLLGAETRRGRELPPELRPLLAHHEALAASLGAQAGEVSTELLAAGAAQAVGLLSAPALSQLPTPDDRTVDPASAFPRGRLDGDLQQVDLRPVNSWRLTLSEVPTAELLEVHLVNAVAPFLLNARLKPLLLRHPTGAQHVVNVSAMEGQFYRSKKTDKHPHTNMAKAALNMLTRTSAPDYVRDGIHMNSVDTGWVTDEDPAVHADRKVAEHDFSPPLDALDGAARICDPIFDGVNTGMHLWGRFLKDYRPTDW